MASIIAISERSLRRYEAEGIDLWDDAAIEAHKATAPSGSEEMKELKQSKLAAETRLKSAQADRAEMLLLQTKGELISIPDLQETMVFIASRVKAHVTKLEKDLPPRLEGKRAVEMVPLVREAAESILLSLSSDLASFDAPTGGDVREETD